MLLQIPLTSRRCSVSDRSLPEFADRAAPVLFKPAVADLEMPDMIETPTGLNKVSEKVRIDSPGRHLSRSSLSI